MSQGYVHIVCVLLNFPRTVLEEKDPARGRVLLCLVLGFYFFSSREDKPPQNIILCPHKHSCDAAAVLEVVVKVVALRPLRRGAPFFFFSSFFSFYQPAKPLYVHTSNVHG